MAMLFSMPEMPGTCRLWARAERMDGLMRVSTNTLDRRVWATDMQRWMDLSGEPTLGVAFAGMGSEGDFLGSMHFWLDDIDRTGRRIARFRRFVEVMPGDQRRQR